MVKAVQHVCMELCCSGRTSFGLLGGPLSLPQLVAASRHHVQAPIHRLHAAMIVVDHPPVARNLARSAKSKRRQSIRLCACSGCLSRSLADLGRPRR